MQIGNNRPNGLQPSKNQNPLLDPDLTKANRDGIEDTTRVSSAKTREAIEDRSPNRAAEARKGAVQDTFQRSRPEENPGPDVSQRIKNARAQAGEKRVSNGRNQNLENTKAAAGADVVPGKAQRIASARAQRAEGQSQRVSQARKQAAGVENSSQDNTKRIANARGQQAEGQGQRVGAARKQAAGVENSSQDNTKRIANARGQEAGKQSRVEGARVQNSEAAQSQRIENARTQYLKNSQVDGVRSARLEAGSIDLPGRSGELPGVSSSSESGSVRAERVANIRKQYAAGDLNTPQRASEAAGRLLGGA